MERSPAGIRKSRFYEEKGGKGKSRRSADSGMSRQRTTEGREKKASGRSVKGKGKRAGQSGKLVYDFVRVLVLAVLIVFAFFAPETVFALQDSVRCGEPVLREQESLDVAAFGVNYEYEDSLYRRLQRFAGEYAGGKRFFVAAQELEPNDDLEYFLNSERGFYQSGIEMLTSLRILPEDFWGYEPREWKQYVIYGDDFAQGVNFIIWYLELGNESGPVVRLLLDAETGSVYGVQSEYDELMEELERRRVVFEKLTELLRVYTGLHKEEPYDLLTFWFWFACRFGGFQESELYETFDLMEKYGYTISGSGELMADIDQSSSYDRELYDTLEQTLREFLELEHYQIDEDERGMDLIFPYEQNSLTFRIEGPDAYIDGRYYGAILANMTVGFQEIYELIPEFQRQFP